MTLAEWLQGELDKAGRHEKESLRVIREFNDSYGAAQRLERLAWIAAKSGDCERAAVLLGAVQQIWPLYGGRPMYGLPEFLAAHDECERAARRILGDSEFDEAFRHGTEFELDQAIDYALGEHTAPSSTPDTALTKREREILELVAEGLSNKDIAARLVIARRTVEGHVHNILAKLGFTKRTQLATWVIRRP
jgi:non-specific serine/threonine protein kinase